MVSEKGDWKLIEISDERGVMLDLISVAETDLDVIWRSALISDEMAETIGSRQADDEAAAIPPNDP